MVITQSLLSLNHTDIVGKVVIGGSRRPPITASTRERMARRF
jgi:hypothetical protein